MTFKPRNRKMDFSIRSGETMPVRDAIMARILCDLAGFFQETAEGIKGKELGVRSTRGRKRRNGKSVIVARVRDRETKEREPAGRKPRKKESGYGRENGFRVPGTDASKKRELSRFDNSQNVKVSSELRLTRNFQLSGIPERL